MKKSISLLVLLAVIALSKTAYCTIVGQLSTCPGYTLLVHDSTAAGVSSGGSWSSSNPSVATVMLGFGQITSVSPGTTIITYTGSSGMSTAVFTVNPAPAPITFTTLHVCTGSTISLSHPTSGGTWTSAGAGATVTGGGTVTGVTANATVGISYTLSPGCRSSVVVTVDPATAFAKIESQVCPSGTGTWVGYPAGGTWSVSSPSVATIDPATGVMTGVSVGTSMVTYQISNACGLVNDTAVAKISGTLELPDFWYAIWSTGPDMRPGETMSLSVLTEYAGGTWTSSAPSIASVSSYASSTMFGYVTAHAVGSANISYTLANGTCPTVSLVKSIDVSNDCISGKAIFPSPISGDPGLVKVWLIKYNPVTHLLTAVDSAKIGGFQQFTFGNVGTDSFRIKVSYDSLAAGTGAQPTYHNSSPYWNSASVIHHTAGVDDTGKNIVMMYGAVTAGPGFISGDVTTGANKGTADYVPAPGVLVFCVDNATGAIIQSAYTNASGHYSFSGLPVDKTYRIYPEEINYLTTPNPVTLTSGTTSVTAAHFQKHSVSLTITPLLSYAGDVMSKMDIHVFPIPADRVINIQWPQAASSYGHIEIADVWGRRVISKATDIAKGTETVDVSALSAGVYFLTFRSATVSYTTKVEVL